MLAIATSGLTVEHQLIAAARNGKVRAVRERPGRWSTTVTRIGRRAERKAHCACVVFAPVVEAKDGIGTSPVNLTGGSATDSGEGPMNLPAAQSSRRQRIARYAWSRQ